MGRLLVRFSNNEKTKNTLPRYYIFFDTETKNEKDVKKIINKEYNITKHSLKLGWAVLWDRKNNTEEWYEYYTIKEFQWWISKQISKTKNASLWLVAHNIVFDSVILNLWDILFEKGFETDFIHQKGMVFLHKLKRNKKVIQFVNNGNIFPAKLEVIGETIGLNKLEIDFDEDDDRYLSIYCRRDVEILLVFWREWTNFIEGNGFGKLKFTISAQSMETFKKAFCKHYIYIPDDKIRKLERCSYYGGRTEIFYKGKVEKSIYYYDINSMYPYVMKNMRYPIEYKFTKIYPMINYVKKLMDKNWLCTAECVIKTDEPVYPCKDINGLIFPIGEFKTYLNTPEIEYAIKNNHIIEFVKVQFYKGDFIFEKYVEYFYGKRQKLKMEKNKQEQMYKLFLNSLYGKFGQKTSKWENISEDEVKKIIPDFDYEKFVIGDYKPSHVIANGVNIKPSLRNVFDKIQIAVDERDAKTAFPTIAGHVTSYARMLLYSYLKNAQINGSKVYYCDTDSLFIDTELTDGVDQYELGKLKLEKTFKNGVFFIGLKNYCELNEYGEICVKDKNDKNVWVDYDKLCDDYYIKGNQWKTKGIRGTAVVLNNDTFMQQEWSGISKQLMFKKYGRVDGEFWVLDIVKKNLNQIKKGQLLEDGNIIPFDKKRQIS